MRRCVMEVAMLLEHINLEARTKDAEEDRSRVNDKKQITALDRALLPVTVPIDQVFSLEDLTVLGQLGRP